MRAAISTASSRDFDEAAIGRDGVAGVEHDDVARDELDGRYLGQLAVAQHPREGRHHRLQRLSGLLGSVFLDEADPGIEHHDTQDADRELEIRRVHRPAYRVDDEREARGHHQDDGKHVRELGGELLEHRPAPCRG